MVAHLHGVQRVVGSNPIAPTKHFSGFTLIELLIAMAISALIFTLLISGLKTVIDRYQVLETRARQFRQLQTAMMAISKDLKNIAPRSITDEQSVLLPPLLGRPDYLELSVFSDDGLARHAYFLKDHALIQRVFTALDRAQPLEYKDTVLLKSVNDLVLNYLSEKNLPVTQWPVIATVTAYPVAITIDLTIMTDNNKTAISRFLEVEKSL